jgi:hypothetical protein
MPSRKAVFCHIPNVGNGRTLPQQARNYRIRVGFVLIPSHLPTLAHRKRKGSKPPKIPGTERLGCVCARGLEGKGLGIATRRSGFPLSRKTQLSELPRVIALTT